MTLEIFEQLEPLAPLDFFNLSAQIQKVKAAPSMRQLKKQLLPDTSSLLSESSFADVACVWSKEALIFGVFVHKSFSESLFPDFAKGDCLELFIDTRDLKSAGFMTKFCHHFLILPQELQGGVKSHEITHFRTEDAHALCDPEEIVVETAFTNSSYEMQIIVPASCLHGYDPTSFNRLGFTYRLNRYKAEPQHFAISSRTYTIEKHPSRWATLTLV